MTIAARPVFAVAIDPTSGDVKEDGWEAVGRATTAEEAVGLVAAAGWFVGGAADIAPAEVVGGGEDGWAVPAYPAGTAADIAADLAAIDLDCEGESRRGAVAAAMLREADGGHGVSCEWDAEDLAEDREIPLPLARAAIAAYSRAAIEAARDALPWVIAAPDGRVADLGPENSFEDEDEAEAALDNLCSTCTDWEDLSNYFVRQANFWEVRR